MKFWIATANKGKLGEFKLLLQNAFGTQTEIYSISDLPVFFPPPENGKTYLENARIKTKALKAVKPGEWVLGDDSGIEVLGLGNLPGIHSSRYAGAKASDSENRVKMLKMMQIKGVTDRAAQFKCCLVVYTPTGEEWVIETDFKGTIAKKESGNLGFGYDSIFIPEGNTKTLAEIGPSYKNQYSHRGLAIKTFIEKVKADPNFGSMG